MSYFTFADLDRGKGSKKRKSVDLPLSQEMEIKVAKLTTPTDKENIENFSQSSVPMAPVIAPPTIGNLIHSSLFFYIF